MLVVGQRHEAHHAVVQRKVFEGAVEAPHPDGAVGRAAEDALAVGIATTALTSPSHQRRVLTNPCWRRSILCDSLSVRPLMICWPSSITAAAHTTRKCLEGVDERPVDVVQRALALVRAGARPTTKCTPSSSVATRITLLPTEGRALSAIEIHSFMVQSSEA